MDTQLPSKTRLGLILYITQELMNYFTLPQPFIYTYADHLDLRRQFMDVTICDHVI